MITTEKLKTSQLSALAFALILAGCGGGGSEASSTPAPSPAPTPSPAPGPSTAGDLSSTIQFATYTSGSREATAYATLNAARLAGGFGTVAQSAALDAEANNQAAFAAQNYSESDVFGGQTWNAALLASLQPDGYETGHIQLSTTPGYTAYSPQDRAVYFGYPSGAPVAESASFPTLVTSADNGPSCVMELLSSPGHRQAILDPRYRDVGIGFSTLAQPFDPSNTALFGQACYIATAAKAATYAAAGEASAPADWVGVYPANGSTGVLLIDNHGHGFAPSVTVDSHLVLTTSAFTLKDGSGNIVPTTLNVDLQQGVWANWAFATPNAAALLPNTTYTASFQGSAGTLVISKTWTFTTGAN